MSSIIHTKIRILWKMYLKSDIGEKHTAPQTVLRTIKTPNAAKALKQLIKDGLVISHPTSYGNQISLNHNRIEEIEKLIEDLLE